MYIHTSDLVVVRMSVCQDVNVKFISKTGIKRL